MKKTNKVKMGPLGTPLGNPLGYFNSLKGKRSVEPKQTLRKAQNGDFVKDNILKGVFPNSPTKFSSGDIKTMDAMYPSTKIIPLSEKRGPRINSPVNFGNRLSNADAIDDERFNRKMEEEHLRKMYEQKKLNSNGSYFDESNIPNIESDNQESIDNNIRMNSIKRGIAPDYKKGGATKAKPKQTLRKAQKGGYTVTNKDGSPVIISEDYRPPSVPSYPDFKKLKKTNPSDVAFMQLAKNPEEFNPKDVKKYGPKKPSKRMIKKMNKESESTPMQTTPYKKGGFVKSKKK